MVTIGEIKANLGSMNERQIYRDKASHIIDQLTDFVESIATGSSSNIPSNTVAYETTWDITPSAGASSSYSRGDHTHGMPTSPQGGGTPSDSVFGETTFGINSNSGSGTPYSRGDHTHGTPTNPVTAHESTYNHPTFITQSAITTHAGSTISVHNFDSFGNAPAQTHDNTKHSATYIVQANAVVPNGAITGATNTKITYDAKGLVTAGIAATTADIADSSDKRYCTDAQKTVITNTSGTNTGDNSANSSTMYIGTTAHTLNRASAAETLVGLTLTTPIIGAATGTSLAATGAITSSGGGVGYATGAGGTVTQLTSRTTTVTLNKLCGNITMFSAAQAANALVTFTLTNSFIAATDYIAIQHISATNGGAWSISTVAGAGTATINIRNHTTASITEATPLRFVVIKGVTA